MVSQKVVKSRKLPKSVRPEEFKKLIKKVPKTDHLSRISFLLAYGAGLRISECLKLTASEIRESNSTIFISDSKGGKDRVVPIPKGWKSHFERLLPLSEHVSARTLQRKFKFYASKADLNPKYSFHSLRHGFATRLVESGVPINQVQILMGHSDLSTTNVYTKASPVDAIKSYEELF